MAYFVEVRDLEKGWNYSVYLNNSKYRAETYPYDENTALSFNTDLYSQFDMMMKENRDYEVRIEKESLNADGKPVRELVLRGEVKIPMAP